MIKRTLNLSRVGKHSTFLFGPRQVGKTSLVKETVSADLVIELLKDKDFSKYGRHPSLLGKEIMMLQKEHPVVVIDEIQRCPELLNEIHWLIEERIKPQFFLTGSSARKLRQKGVNLLGGRALQLKLHPFTHEELGENFSLEASLVFGHLPPVVVEPDPEIKRGLLSGYIETYLKEEIQQEAVVRNIHHFAHFLDLAGHENGNILNFSNISREVGISSMTIKNYFQILEDTLVGFFLFPYTRSHREKLLLHPKFYLFDVGVTRALQKNVTDNLLPGSFPYGKLFEHWVILETKRLLDYREREWELRFFATADGAEVDLILMRSEELWAVEIKSSPHPALAKLRGLRSFISDHTVTRALCVCQAARPYREGRIEFLPWQTFLSEL